MRLTAKRPGRWGRRSVALRAQVACGIAGEEVLDPEPYTRVRANHPISTSQQFLTTACWSLNSPRSVVFCICSNSSGDGHTRQAWGERPDQRVVTRWKRPIAVGGLISSPTLPQKPLTIISNQLIHKSIFLNVLYLHWSDKIPLKQPMTSAKIED